MVFKGILTDRKYFGKLFLWFTAAISLMVVVLAMLAYLTVQQIFMKNEYEMSKKILKQLKFNIEFVDETIKNSSKFLFLNSDISYILNSAENSFPQNELYSKLNNATSPVMLSNAYIHSICLYNSNGEQYYYAGKSMYFDDKDLKEIIRHYPDVPKQKPLFRRILFEYGSTQHYENVLTYIMYETSGSPRRIDSAVIINARPEWLLDNISGMDENEKDRMFIMDDKGVFLGKDGRDEGMEKALAKEFGRYNSDGANMPDSFICRLMEREYVVTYDDISSIGFVLFRIRPLQEVYKYVDLLKINMMIVGVVALVLSLLISIAVSKKLYKPLDGLVKQVSDARAKEPGFEQYDEIAYLNNVYKYSMGKLAQYYDEKVKNRNIIKAYWLKKLLTENEIINQEQYDAICTENMINLPYDYSYVACVLSIDGFKGFQRANDLRSRELIRFAIINIMTESLSLAFAVEGVDISEEKIVLLVGIKPEQHKYADLLEECLKNGQNHVEKYFDISVTASVGEQVGCLWKISQSYENAVDYSYYRFLLGKKSIIVKEKILQNYSNAEAVYSGKNEAKLTESIKSRDLQGIDENLRLVINDIALCSYDNIKLMLVELVELIKNSVNSVLELESSANRFNAFDFKHRIYEVETLEEFREMLLEALKNVVKAPPQNVVDVKSRVIAETVVDIISKSYWDKNLCINQIASMVKLNPRRLAKSFKDYKGVSVPDFINDLRLSKAAELLENSRLNVYDIKDRTGFENESYFYRMFKAKFGYTPKEYALFKNVEKS